MNALKVTICKYKKTVGSPNPWRVIPVPKEFRFNPQSGNIPRLLCSIPSWGAYRRQSMDVSLSH